MVLLLFSPSFSADPDLCHRSGIGNSHWLLCGLIHIYFFNSGGGKETITVENHVIKLAGKRCFMYYCYRFLKVWVFLLFVCLFVFWLFG